jgi:uncharacterized membrane protein YdbT with pleckstrin-like domain
MEDFTARILSPRKFQIKTAGDFGSENSEKTHTSVRIYNRKIRRHLVRQTKKEKTLEEIVSPQQNKNHQNSNRF